MPAAGAAFEINVRQLDERAQQDFSGVILQMEKQGHLDRTDKGPPRVGIASTIK
jgi:hypothetical protein